MVAISPHLSFRRYIAVESMSDLMRDRLRESDWIFSGMKTYNRRYLNAEYNFANASAEMAGRWERFEEDEDRHLLQYRTQNDGAVRPEHAELHGITLPASDSFWGTCYPPNGWNCRCTVVQVLKDKYQETDHNEAMRLGGEALSKDSKGMFAFNPGKQEKVFPDYNPYTISRCKNCPKTQGNLASGVPDNQLCEACSVLLTKMEKERQEVLPKEDRKHILQSTKEWVASHLPEETLPDGIIAHRAHIQVEGHDLILNKEFFNETFAKNKRNSKLPRQCGSLPLSKIGPLNRITLEQRQGKTTLIIFLFSKADSETQTWNTR